MWRFCSYADNPKSGKLGFKQILAYALFTKVIKVETAHMCTILATSPWENQSQWKRAEAFSLLIKMVLGPQRWKQPKRPWMDGWMDRWMDKQRGVHPHHGI